ncbi:uncharacterized protein LOC126818272 [Patella vulgata]|uniref:uncharacterized protein LOC126818272 n=1 Tax=Patella vulgata TaxID=6465 RepID=UPI0021801205|nr:uncharacterized protein LOC126818272 [Patella vulgata]
MQTISVTVTSSVFDRWNRLKTQLKFIDDGDLTLFLIEFWESKNLNIYHNGEVQNSNITDMTIPYKNDYDKEERCSNVVKIAHSLDEVDCIIKHYEVNTSSKFITKKKEKCFGNENIVDDMEKQMIRFEDTQPNAVPKIIYDRIPFVIAGKKIMECHLGIDRDKKKKEERRKKIEDLSNTDHSFAIKKRKVQDSKKKMCPVQIKIRHIVKFPDFKLSKNTKRSRDNLSRDVRSVIDSDFLTTKIEHQYIIFLPAEDDHRNHFKGEKVYV